MVMKHIYLLFILFSFNFVFAQIQVCQDEIITLQSQTFRGELSWEVSDDGIEWVNIFTDTASSYNHTFTDSGTYFIRGKIIENDCEPIYTDTQEVVVNPLPDFPVILNNDTILLDETTISINAEMDGSGGEFNIISGENGILEGDFNPFNRMLTGELGERYLVTYSRENNCGVRSDTVAVAFCSDTLRAIAGNDLLKRPGTQVVLTPTLQTPYDQGSWSILEGSSGSFEFNTNAQHVFNGMSLGNYKLLWTVVNGCGTFYDTLSVSFSSCPSDSITFEVGNTTVTYGLISGDFNNGEKCWFDRNLGASKVAEAMNDQPSYGFYYQWGRLTDGHQVSNSPTVNTLSPSDVPGTNRYITISDTQPYDWRSPQNNNLWQAPANINNPCPDGWRVPTRQEWLNEASTWSAQNRIGAFTSPLKLPVTGLRNQTGSISGTGTSGNYWTQTPATPSAFYFSFGQFSASIFGEVRAVGMPVRCIKN